MRVLKILKWMKDIIIKTFTDVWNSIPNFGGERILESADKISKQLQNSKTLDLHMTKTLLQYCVQTSKFYDNLKILAIQMENGNKDCHLHFLVYMLPAKADGSAYRDLPRHIANGGPPLGKSQKVFHFAFCQPLYQHIKIYHQPTWQKPKVTFHLISAIVL